jgi:rhodanese-related sulfurtransferase
MNIKSSQTLVAEALSEIKTISTDEAHKMSNEDKCNLIDIRDIRELEKEGRVENSNHIPRGMLEFWLDPESPYFKEGRLDMN